MDHTSLGNDVGVNAKTISNWLSVLEAPIIIFKLPPFLENFGKRVIKSPKYYFMEVGLLVYLLGIEKPEQVSRDPLVGAIFENLVVLECLKSQVNRSEMSNLYFFRDSNGSEIDILIPKGSGLIAIEIKSSATFKDSHMNPIGNFSKITERVQECHLVYNGANRKLSNNNQLIRFDQVSKMFD